LFKEPLVLPLPPVTEKRVSPVNPVAAGKALVDMAAIVKLLNDSEWSAVLARVDEACVAGNEDSELWQIKAKALANLGHAQLALQACEHSLRLDPVNKHTYLIQGLILAELDRLPEAEAALRKTLYLDRSFLEAHYELGMLRVRAKDFSGALKSLGNALRQAQAGDPERELHNAAGMTYGRFVEVLKNEIGMLRDAR
jgi:chemotaxis protein methyltransferase CheR